MDLKDYSEFKKIELLLDKYWEGKTSVAEENHLKNYFKRPDVAEHLKYIQPYFYALDEEKSVVLPPSFDKKLLSSIKTKETRVLSKEKRMVLTQVFKLAAAFALILIVIFVFQTQFNASKQAKVQDVKLGTFNDPVEAYDQVKKSLLLISNKMNKGKSYVSDLSKLNAGARRFNRQKASIKK